MNKKKILVVDDEPHIVEAVKFRLEANNYEVITAPDGQEGLKKAKAAKPDLVILDIVMPGMDGTAVAAALKDDLNTKDIPVIFLTCLVKKTEEKKAEHMIGHEFIIAKPFEAEELLSMIDKAMKK